MQISATAYAELAIVSKLSVMDLSVMVRAVRAVLRGKNGIESHKNQLVAFYGTVAVFFLSTRLDLLNDAISFIVK